MNQKEKKQMSKERILNAAIVEFGTKNYENASLNNICSDNGISKGLIYHYFKNKDELYLNCVKNCLDALIEHMTKNNTNSNDFGENLQKYLDLRYRFFQDNEHFSNIFFQIVLQPPKHLKEDIKQLRNEFDQFNINHYKNALSNVTLREGITQEEAIEYFFIFQEMFNGYFQSKAYEGSDFHSIIEAHELKLSKVLNIMLYGIAKER